MNQYFYQNPYQQNGYNPMNLLTGKMVNDFGTITASDVPMNGQFAFFPKSDLSEIEVKFWNQNGMINSLKFKPEIEHTNILSTDNTKCQNDTNNAVTMALKEISERLSAIENSLIKTYSKKGGQNEYKSTDSSNE